MTRGLWFVHDSISPDTTLPDIPNISKSALVIVLFCSFSRNKHPGFSQGLGTLNPDLKLLQ